MLNPWERKGERGEKTVNKREGLTIIHREVGREGGKKGGRKERRKEGNLV